MIIRWISACLAPLMVLGCSDFTEDLPGGYYYYFESKRDQIITREGWSRGDPYIPCRVEAYDADERFIVAKQKATEICFVEGTNPMAESAGETFFWIIDTEQHVFFGPLRHKRDFEAKRLELEVSASLR